MFIVFFRFLFFSCFLVFRVCWCFVVLGVSFFVCFLFRGVLVYLCFAFLVFLCFWVFRVCWLLVFLGLSCFFVFHVSWFFVFLGFLCFLVSRVSWLFVFLVCVWFLFCFIGLHLGTIWAPFGHRIRCPGAIGSSGPGPLDFELHLTAFHCQLLTNTFEQP